MRKPPTASRTAHVRAVALAVTLGVLVAAGDGGPSGPGSGSARAGDESAVAATVRAWRKVEESGDLVERYVALSDVVRTGDPEALRVVLGALRATKGVHTDKLRELIAPSVARTFADPKFAGHLHAAVVTDVSGPEQAWLAHLCATEWFGAGHPDLALQLFDDADGSPSVQAAVLRACVADPPAGARDRALRTLGRLPADPVASALLLESASRVLEAWAGRRGEDDVTTTARMLIDVLDHPRIQRRSRLLVGRVLKRLLETPCVYADAAGWNQALDDRRVLRKAAQDGYAVGGHTYFMGLAFEACDIVFVIDSSGSMSADFAPPATKTPGPRKGGTQGPVTGGPSADPKRREAERAAKSPADAMNGFDDLPWDKIRTRFDAVREALKHVVRALRAEQSVAVVFFSNDARTLDATPCLVPATPRNVKAICDELDRRGPAGATNLHRGLEIAFDLAREGPAGVKQDPATRSLLAGADAVVILSDGSPNADSYSAPRRGGTALFASDDALTAAERRLNLFRDAEVHCVGFKDAPGDLLRALAALGRGQVRILDE